MQPQTHTVLVGSSSLGCFSCPSTPKNFLSAFSRTLQVFRMTTSAVSFSSVFTNPSASSMPARVSESRSFIWQPKVMI